MPKVKHRIARAEKPGLRLTIGDPEVPGAKVHHGFGEHSTDVGIVGMRFVNVAHGRGGYPILRFTTRAKYGVL